MNSHVDPLTARGIAPVAARLDSDCIAALNAWRLKQNPPLAQTDAIIALVHIALAYEEVTTLPAEPRIDAATERLINVFREARRQS